MRARPMRVARRSVIFSSHPCLGRPTEHLVDPNVFESEREIYMLYNGNEFGRHGFGLAILER